MKKLLFFIVSLLFFSCIQKRTPTDTEESTNDAMVADTIIESCALIEDDTLFDAVYGIIENPIKVKTLSVAPYY